MCFRQEIDGRAITCNNARQMVERVEGEEAPPAKPPGVCFAWQKGECTRGDSCRFRCASPSILSAKPYALTQNGA